MPSLVTALADLLVRRQNAVHRPHGANVLALVEELGVDLPWCLVGEAVAVEDGEDVVALGGRERAPRRRPRLRRGPRFPRAVEARTRDAECSARDGDTDDWDEVVQRCRHDSSSSGGTGTSIPSSAANFFWTSMMISAFRSSCCSRSFCRRSRSTSLAAASRFGFGPRLLGPRATSPPSSRSFCQRWTCVHVMPSRRRNAPCAPRSPDAPSSSISRSTRCLNAASYTRFVGCFGRSPGAG